MLKKPHRIIVDTNLWISFLINKNFSRIDNLLILDKVELLFSRKLILEIFEVVERPKFKKYFLQSDINILTNIINENCTIIEVNSNVKLCRDEKDNFLLSLAKDAAADFILTGDKDLLELYKFENTKILTISNYLDYYL